MNFKGIEISNLVIDFFRKNQLNTKDIDYSNSLLEQACGIRDFFNDTYQIEDICSLISERSWIIKDSNRREYGDYQTNPNLAKSSVELILSHCVKNIEFILEPTCGKGSFIVAALKCLPNLKKIFGIEIFQPYIWETKFKILEHFIQNQKISKPKIEIIQANVFDFDFDSLAKETKDFQTLIIGNPPWVTNSELGTLDSENLPHKYNIQKHNGFDAMTGKGNFDISEAILLKILSSFSYHQGYLGFLIKNSIAKNIIFNQNKNSFSIGNFKKYNINAKQEFDASVGACFFISELNYNPEKTCKEYDFYSCEEINTFGWANDCFVNSIRDYEELKHLEGKSQFEWRQGIKHDCSKIMELEHHNGHFINGFNQEVNIETDLVYGLLKGSDLKEYIANSYRKLVLVTQKKIGQDTSYIQKEFQLSYNYLESNLDYFAKRKSSIYEGKPLFSIFGVGDYSFLPYKVAISGLHKSTHFTLVLPHNNKPIMLDDTCYFIGFENLKFAEIAHFLLNQNNTQKFLKSIVFSEAKRAITKEILMRIDFYKLFQLCNSKEICNQIDVSEEDWWEFGKILTMKNESKQLTFF